MLFFCLMVRAYAGILWGDKMRIAAAVFFMATSAVPATASCFEDIGCTDDQFISLSALHRLSCENLWYARNSIYHDNFYCFATDRGRASFDNSGCSVSNANAVHLNNFERSNISHIQQVEREYGCPR